MTEREKLIELIQNAVDGCAKHWAEVIADHLLANGVIVPPCKVGNNVWWVTDMCDENGDEYLGIYVGKVVSFSLQKEGLWAYCRYEGGLTYWHLVADYFGKTVFLTKEEAEKALMERSEGDDCQRD